jgi:hypothetical protein
LAGNIVVKSMKKIKARKREIQIKKVGGKEMAWILEASLAITTIGVIFTPSRGLLTIVLDLKTSIKGGWPAPIWAFPLNSKSPSLSCFFYPHLLRDVWLSSSPWRWWLIEEA